MAKPYPHAGDRDQSNRQHTRGDSNRQSGKWCAFVGDDEQCREIYRAHLVADRRPGISNARLRGGYFHWLGSPANARIIENKPPALLGTPGALRPISAISAALAYSRAVKSIRPRGPNDK
jgi:hypothetical protein